MRKPYTKPSLYDAKGDIKKKWYVTYSYLDPATNKLRRFRLYEGINSLKTKADRRDKAATIIKTTLELLEDGYNPFLVDSEQGPDVTLTLQNAIQRFVEIKKTSVRDKTLLGYRSVLKQVEAYFSLKGKHLTPIPKITSGDVQGYFDYAKANRKRYANTTYNAELTTLRVFFDFWRERGQGAFNPARSIKRLRESPAQHTAYTDEELNTLTEVLRAKDTPAHKQLLQFCQFVYYACIRPKELRALRVRDINFREMTITVRGELAKSGRTESVSISEGLLAVIDEMNIRDMPANYYVFANEAPGTTGNYFKPGPGLKPVGQNHFSDFFRQVLNELGFATEKTLYGLKHTRNIHLYQDGVDIYRIMRHNRHTSLDITQKYLRNLGLFMDTKIVDTRKI